MSVKTFIRACSCSFIAIAFCFLSGACAYNSYGTDLGELGAELYRIDHGVSPSYSSPFGSSNSSNSYSYPTPTPAPNQSGNVDYSLIFGGGRSEKKKNTSNKRPNTNTNNKSVSSSAHLPPLKDVQKNFRTMLSAQGITSAENLKDQNFAWVFDDDLDTVKVLLRENKNNAWLAFREQTEPWYQDNPYCVGAISGFSQFNENTFVWAPPTMEEHIRAFFKLKCSDAALQRLCEAQFITNYNVLHYKVFCSRLMKIQGQAKGKDATALITAYAKELEAKGPKVFQEREAWRGEPFDVSTNNERIKNMQDRFTNTKPKFIFDPQTLKDAMLARFERTETIGQNYTLIFCFATIRIHNTLLRNAGIKDNTNKLLQELTQWLQQTAKHVPCSDFIQQR